MRKAADKLLSPCMDDEDDIDDELVMALRRYGAACAQYNSPSVTLLLLVRCLQSASYIFRPAG